MISSQTLLPLMQIKRLRPLLHDKAMLPCVCRNGRVGLVIPPGLVAISRESKASRSPLIGDFELISTTLYRLQP
jgi:hypothetical protein